MENKWNSVQIKQSQLDTKTVLTTRAVILLVLLHHVIHYANTTCLTSHANVTLQRHVVSSLSLPHIFDCWQRCKKDDRCQSLNYYVKRLLCEINNRTIDLAPDDEVNVPYAAYFENPFRAAVGTTKNMPAVSCAEILKSVGNVSGRYWLIDHARSGGPFKAYCNMNTLAIESCKAGQCQNGGICTYLGMDRYQCACPAKTSGQDCEIRLSVCFDSPCKNGGTCVDRGDSFTCQCPEAYFGDRCQSDACSDYFGLVNSDRRTSHVTTGSIKCDSSLPAAVGWYRFTGGAGTQMVTSCPPINRCQTSATGWLNGGLPSTIGTIYTRSVFFHWSGNCYHRQQAIKVKLCPGGFYVYELTRTPCNYRYCGQ